MGASKGKQETTNTPWGPLQPYLQDIFKQGQGIVNNPPQYYPGQTYVDMNPQEQAALQSRENFATSAFPNLFGNASGALSDLTAGNTNLGAFGNTLAGTTANQFGNLYQTPYARSAQTGWGGPSMAGQAGLASMLSGNPDTRGFEGALTAAFDPLVTNWQNNILPGIQATDYAAGGGQGSSGAGKLALMAGNDLSRQMANTAGSLGYNAYQDAMARQAQGVGLAQGWDQLGQGNAYQNAALRQQANLANQQANLTNQGNILQGAGLGGNLLGQQTQDQSRALALTPSITQLGTLGADQLAQAGQGYRQQNELALADQMNRFNFGQQQPMNMLSWYNSLLQPSLGFGTQTTPGNSSPIMSGLGGALSGATLGTMAGGPWGAIGGALGGLAGLFG